VSDSVGKVLPARGDHHADDGSSGIVATLLWIGAARRLGYLSRGVTLELAMVDPVRRARLLRELEEEFVPDYDANSMPAADKRAAYALEHIAFRIGRIEQILTKIADAIETRLSKA
jgi:hypothetical protein